MKKFFRWIKDNKLAFLATAFGGVLRFYRLRDLTTFGGDQGVDYQVVATMLLTHRPTLLGPVTHVGIFLGPLYYYLLAPAFLLFRFDPIAAPVFFAIIGTATVGLIYFLAREFLSPLFAFLTALLYAVSPVILESSRAPSQPHLIPFFATFLLILLSRLMKRPMNGPVIASGIGVVLGSVIQFHFLTFPLFLFVGVFVFLYLRQHKEIRTAHFLLWLTIPIVILMAPWGLFELRHQFFITHQITTYLSSGDINGSLPSVLSRALDLIWFSSGRLIGRESQFVTLALLLASCVGLVVQWQRKAMRHVFLYALLNIVGLSLYVDPFSNHYISALYPLVVLLPVIGISRIFSPSAALLMLSSLIVFNSFGNDLFRNHGYTMPSELTTSVIQHAAEIIHQDVQIDSYEVANLLDGDTRAQPYRYLLSAIYRKPPLPVDAYPSAQTLYVIGRNQESAVINNAVWEVSILSPKILSKTWPLSDTIVLYRFDRASL